MMPLTEEQVLQRAMEDLDERLKELERRRESVPRPPVELKHEDQAEVDAQNEAEEAASKLRRAEEKAKEEEEEKREKKEADDAAAAAAKGLAAADTKKAAPAHVAVPNEAESEEGKVKYTGAEKPKQDVK
eukprot:evm.model.NODE_22071_length_6807_cov_32.914795.1